MRERTGNSKGIGFARIDYKEMCEKIIKELNGQPFPSKCCHLFDHIDLLRRFEHYRQ